MTSRKLFLQQASLGFLSSLLLPIPDVASNGDFSGIVVNAEEGEAFHLRDGKAIVKIKIAKVQGAGSLSLLSESFKPGEERRAIAKKWGMLYRD